MKDDYKKFLDRSARLMERALTQDIDIFVDYTGEHQEMEGQEFSHVTRFLLVSLCFWFAYFVYETVCRDYSLGEKLKQQRVFYDEHWSKHRLVTCMDWSKQVNTPVTKLTVISLLIVVYVKSSSLICLQYQELLLASYSSNPELPHEPDGICVVWNSMFKKDSPEYIFHCQVSSINTYLSSERSS